MNPYRIILGDARDHHPSIEDGSVRCAITSVPYWGLRDYGVDEQIGLERTPEEWVRVLVGVFRHVHRYLAANGTLWINVGDRYAGSGRGGYAGGKSTLQGSMDGQDQSRAARVTQSRRRDNALIPRSDGRVAGLKPKDLIGLPWMLAFALRADGWYLRSDTIWHKPNAMPGSAKDRPTTAHEYIFLLTKSRRYYFDGAAIAEPCSKNTHARIANHPVAGWANGTGSHQTIDHNQPGVNPKAAAVTLTRSRKHQPKQNGAFSAAIVGRVEVRRSRSVWSIPTQGYKGSHYATFPRELAARCIKAGSAAGDLVLDPFLGTGTVIAEALLLGRCGVGIELNPDSVQQSHERMQELCPLFAQNAEALPA